MASQQLLVPSPVSASFCSKPRPVPQRTFLSQQPSLQRQILRKPHFLFFVRAKAKSSEAALQQSPHGQNTKESKERVVVEQQEDEEEEEMPWIQDKAMDLVEFTGSVTQAIPGPRVGQSPLPWILAIPMAYVGLSLVVAVVKTVRKFYSPKQKRRKLVNKNAMLCISIDELFQTGRDSVQHSSLKGLMQKTGFSMEEILRKYVRYVLNEKPFTPDLVMNLIHLRKVSMLDDAQVAGVLNEVSRRIVREKGPVVMDISGFTEKGFKRKLAVKTLFGKIFYLAEIPDFCSRDSSLIIKEIFGVTDEDADTLRLHTLSEAGDVDSLERLVDNSDLEETSNSSDEGNPNENADLRETE